MILADSSVWIDHLRGIGNGLADLLDADRVLIHPFVIAELALGNLRDRQLILEMLNDLPMAVVANDGEILPFIEKHRLNGLGIGFVDVHLLASARLTEGSSLWTRDRRLNETAERLGLAHA